MKPRSALLGACGVGFLLSQPLPAAGPAPVPEVLTTANYAFATTTTGSLADLSTGSTQLIGPNQTDYASPLAPIGFDFYFRGIRQTQFSVNANGVLQFGSLAQTGSPFRPLGQTNRPLLTPYGASLRLHPTGKVHAKLFGSAPARMLVVEWRNVQSIPAPGGDPDLTFQAQIHEGTGVIRYVYGGMTLSPFVTADLNTSRPHIGFSTSSLAGTVGSVLAPQSGSPGPSYDGSAATPQQNDYVGGPLTALTSAADGARRTLTFTPPVPAAPTGLSFSGVTLSGMTLTWSDAPNEQGYALYVSTDGTNFSYFDAVGENVTSYTTSDLAASTTYHWRVYSVSEGALSATPLAGSQPTLAGAFSGTYTVGPGGHYASLGAAVGALVTGGTNGPVQLELLPAYVGSGETYPLTIARIPGATAATPVTIRPAAGATALSISSAAATTLDLNGARSVIVDGRPGGAGSPQLTVANTSTSGVAVRFRNDASRNTLRSLTAAGVNTAATGGVVLFDTTTGPAGNDDNLLEACIIRDGATTPANGIASLGTTTTPAQANSGNVVQNCSILNFFGPGANSRGILLGAGTTDWTIQGNSLYQTDPRSGSVDALQVGISVENTSGHGFVIANNVIGGSAPNAAGSPWTLGPASRQMRLRGISVSAGFDRITSVQGNVITNLALSSSYSQSLTFGGNFCGIFLNSGEVAVGTVAGNTIGAATGTGAISLTSGFGGAASGILTASNGIQPTIANNQIGSVTTFGAIGTASHSFTGIALVAASVAGTIPIVGNTIGSATTPASLRAATATTGTAVQGLFGLTLSATSNVSVVGNLVANLQNDYAPATPATARVVGGIVNTNSVVSLVGNTIRNLSAQADATGTGANASVVGIVQAATAAPSSVAQNLIHSLANTHPTSAVAVVGLHQTSNASAVSVVARNFVHSLAVSSSSAAAAVVGMASGSGLNSFQNNFVALGLDPAGNALTNGLVIHGLQYSAGQNSFYHNSVFVGGSGVGGSASTFAFFSDVATTPRDFRNNVFSNARSNGAGTGSHYAVQVGGTGLSPAGLTMDYNLYFASGTGGIFGRYAGAPVASLTDWRNATGLDLQSLYGNPNFLQTAGGAGAVDLHIAPGGSPVEGSGTLLAAVSLDYDGQTRSTLTPTDLGADAGNFVAGDLQGPRFSFTPLPDTTATVPTTARTLRAFVFDEDSGVPLTGVGLPLLHWRTEATGYTAVTAVPQGGGYYDFTFGGGVSPGTRVFYYLTAQDLAPTPNVTALPLVGASGFSASPPVAATPPSAPFSYTVRQPMAGTFTVGAGGSFGTLRGAVDYVNRSLLTGPTTLRLTDANYSVGAQPVVLEANPGSSATNTLTIQPANGVSATIEGSGESVLKLAGADYVVVNGENGDGPNNITVRITNPSPFTSIISIENLIAAGFVDPAMHNVLRHLRFEGADTTGFAIFSGGLIGAPPEQPNHANWFLDNSISGVQVGICTLGASADGKNFGTRIEGNRIVTPGNPAARVGILAGFEDGIRIHFNQIENLVLTSGPRDCLGIALGADDFFASEFGFPHQECSNATVLSNRIGTLSQTANRSAIGIAVGPTGPGTTLIANNAIFSILSNATGTEFGAGIYVCGQNQPGAITQVLANSISLEGTVTGGGRPIYGLALGANDPVVLARNNTIQVLAANGSAGSNGGSVAIASSTSPPANLDSDRNNFYVGPGADFCVGRVGSLVAGGVSLPTLADWRTATGDDAASLSVPPQQTSPTNLAPLPGSPLLGAGVALLGLPGDFQGAIRPNPPALGAFELAQSGGLSDLRLQPGALVPGFATGRLGFMARVPNAVTSVTVTPTAATPGTAIVVLVNGGPAVPVASGSASPPLALQAGMNRLEIRLTPPTGPAPPPTFVDCEREAQLLAGQLTVRAPLGEPISIPIAQILSAATIGPGAAPVVCLADPVTAQGGTTTTDAQEVRYVPRGSVFYDGDVITYVLQGAEDSVATGTIKVSVTLGSAGAHSEAAFVNGALNVNVFGVPSAAGVAYVVEYTNDLTQPFQTLLRSNGQPLVVHPDEDNQALFTDPTAGPSARRFYRLVAVPVR
ncbi:MAG: fibronectin type III domain-containing protein [Verrucomicrobia bacterium]|nr:fibronectin type III domain-containing protein [Verrucomicrobiota bacterium]